MKAGVVGTGALVALCAWGFIAPAGAGGGAQVVTSSAGAYAWGGMPSATFPDGRTRAITALLAIPDGTVVGSPSFGDVDLARPWAAIRISTPGQPAGLVGVGGCGNVSNPGSWSGARPDGRGSFAGMHAVVSCPGDPFYSSYTIRFEPAGRAFAFPKPQLNTEVWGWSAPAGTNGSLVAEVKAVQTSRLTVCGTRHDGRVDCYGDKNALANVFPSTGPLTVELHTGTS